MRYLTAVLATCLTLAACGDDGGGAGRAAKGPRAKTSTTEIAGVPAVRTGRLNLAACFQEDLTDDTATSTRCPSFALLALDFLNAECTRAGGTLRPVDEPVAWSLDVDGDASGEILVDLRQNIDCQGAPGVFSCGSIGCPYFLYQKRDDSWLELGAINADDAPAIEVLPGPAGTPGTLRGGCTGLRPCSELVHYEWNGKNYERRWIDFRGHAVDVTPGGLWTANKDIAVLDAPHPRRGNVLEDYPVGTAVIVIGDARDAPYKFVSPCNACRRGFVEASALTK